MTLTFGRLGDTGGAGDERSWGEGRRLSVKSMESNGEQR